MSEKASEFHRQTAQLLAVVGVNMPPLSTEEMQRWIDDPLGVKKVLAAAFAPVITVWRTIRIGVRKNIDALRQAIKASGCDIGEWADAFLGKITLPSSSEDVGLIKLSGRDLGFTDLYSLEEAIRAGESKGLARCQPYDMAYLAERYQDQPLGEVVYAAMDPVTGSDGNPDVFYLLRDDSRRWLYALCASPGSRWLPDSLWVFRSRK